MEGKQFKIVKTKTVIEILNVQELRQTWLDMVKEQNGELEFLILKNSPRMQQRVRRHKFKNIIKRYGEYVHLIHLIEVSK